MIIIITIYYYYNYYYLSFLASTLFQSLFSQLLYTSFSSYPFLDVSAACICPLPTRSYISLLCWATFYHSIAA